KRVETVRLLRHQNGEALPPARVGEPRPDFHAELERELVQPGAQGAGVEFCPRPGRLQRHAELPAGDLLLQRLDVGVLLEKKIRDAGNDAGFIAPNYGNGGVLFHVTLGEPGAHFLKVDSSSRQTAATTSCGEPVR